MEFDPNQLTGGEAYKLMVSAVVPRPIAFVSTTDPSGVTNLAPFSYFNVVTSSPPMISIGIGTRRWEGERVSKDTLRNIETTGEFVVNSATRDLATSVNASSAEFPPGVSELTELGLTAGDCQLVKPPRVRESPINMECRLERVVRLGNEPQVALVIGEVVWVHVRDDLWDAEAGMVDAERLQPLARLGGTLYTGLGDLLSLNRP